MLMYELIGQGCLNLEVLKLVNILLFRYYYRSSVVAMNFINNLFTYVYLTVHHCDS